MKLYTTLAPFRAYGDSAGLDLSAAHDLSWKTGDIIQLELLGRICSSGCWWQLGPRSSMFKKGFLGIPSIMDPGYDGPLFLGGYAMSAGSVQAGDRVAQAIPMLLCVAELAAFGERPPHPRGTGGFGSSGGYNK